MSDSPGEAAFANFWQMLAPPLLVDRLESQVVFDPSRGWAADFKIGQVLIEIEGGAFTQGRHTRGAGFTEDCKKYNRATSLNYRVLRYTTEMVMLDPEGVILQVVSVYITSNRDERTKGELQKS